MISDIKSNSMPIAEGRRRGEDGGAVRNPSQTDPIRTEQRGPVQQIQIDPNAQLMERGGGSRDRLSGIGQEYMTTVEAAAYLRKSVSWVVKQADIPYLKGAPNTYRRRDLDNWFESHKEKPRVA